MKNLKLPTILFLFSLLFIQNARCYNLISSDSTPYLKQRLEWFQDQKFGLLMALGLWSQWGIGGPWVISKAPGRIERSSFYDGLELTMPKGGDTTAGWDFNVYRNAYWNLIRTYYPYNFNENEWAAIAENAGAKYMIFYTKHHDGFSLFDTKFSDFKVTSYYSPYSHHPNPDITQRLFEAFRKRGFGIGVYFSYSDWRSPYYWKPNVPISDNSSENRHFNYDINKEPQRWQKFVDYYQGQIQELMTGYGEVDILWLDGGWDKKFMQVGKMVQMARSHQPELIVVSRGGGEYEDYRTPENRVPDKPLGVPWETVGFIRSGSPRAVVHYFVDIVCKGGNWLIDMQNAALSDGRLDPAVVKILSEMGEWLKVNGEAIYGTRIFSMTQFRD
ncbi:MAG: alpha-L-fucosidase, partial [Cyclobacteriaceae bacterium]